ncbi:MAG TPA: A/G-specific adenine glycosylase, partial [Bacteroidia bacterium]|nr:A/G-specific adenine glycosylase [Bacteroidia bacterium]
KVKVKDFSQEMKHVLSHQKLYARFVEIDVKEKLKGKKDWLYIREKELKKYAVPILIADFIKRCNGM